MTGNMKFKIKNKGFISQGFAKNPELYVSRGTPGHTGVDYVKGYGKLHQADNTGFVFKVWKPKEREDRWVAVHQLVPHQDIFMEVITGHWSNVFVEEGKLLKEGEYIGAEGNSGYVFSGNTQITPAMQDAGDKRGSHVHEAYRPVKRVTKKTKGKYYLESKKGDYRDNNGYYYEIMNTDVMKGFIDPMQFVYIETYSDKLRSILNAVLGIKK